MSCWLLSGMLNSSQRGKKKTPYVTITEGMIRLRVWERLWGHPSYATTKSAPLSIMNTCNEWRFPALLSTSQTISSHTFKWWLRGERADLKTSIRSTKQEESRDAETWTKQRPRDQKTRGAKRIVSWMLHLIHPKWLALGVNEMCATNTALNEPPISTVETKTPTFRNTLSQAFTALCCMLFRYITDGYWI